MNKDEILAEIKENREEYGSLSTVYLTTEDYNLLLLELAPDEYWEQKDHYTSFHWHIMGQMVTVFCMDDQRKFNFPINESWVKIE